MTPEIKKMIVLYKLHKILYKLHHIYSQIFRAICLYIEPGYLNITSGLCRVVLG